MPFSPEELAEVQAYVNSIIIKVRIPELAPYTAYGELTSLDRLPIWMSTVNKTVWVTAQDLSTLIETGGTGTITPVLVGSTIIHDVTALEDGGTDVLISTLAGKTFFLRREGRPLTPTEYEILSGGGFRLIIPDDLLIEGQRFDIDVYELQQTAGGGTSTTTGFISGILSVSTNTTLSDSDIGKLIQVRGGAVKVVVTLPLINLVPENSIVIIEASITNDHQTKIQTQGGQYIYLNNTSKSAIYLGLGESIWLFRGADGWYDFKQFGKNYLDLAKPFAAYSIGINEIICKGQSLIRVDYPRLWEKVQTLGASLVSDITWSTATGTNISGQVTPFPYKGCFSTGDGTTTFRLPDLMNMFLRGVKTETGTDDERFANIPGGYQDDELKSHSHNLTWRKAQADQSESGTSGELYDNNPTHNRITATSVTGGAETRGENVGVFWAIKF